MIAQRIDVFWDHEIAIARAVPNVIPERTISERISITVCCGWD
jgi:hypothetical protein